MTPYTFKLTEFFSRKPFKSLSIFVLFAFVLTSLQSPSLAQIDSNQMAPWMPLPGTMVAMSPKNEPAMMVGLELDPHNPFKLNFMIDQGEKPLSGDIQRQEFQKLIKYFLVSLTVPNDDMWVNLSPYEQNRIIPNDFSKTAMGRDLLAEDYILKQITASTIYPEVRIGKEFWAQVYNHAAKEFGTTNVPVNTYNKVWIVPDKAVVYEKNGTALLMESHLKVMLEEDYLALQKHVILSGAKDLNVTLDSSALPQNDTHKIASQFVRKIVLPLLEKEVNEGKNFASLRQAYSGMLMATYFKRSLRQSILGQIYADKNKVLGVNLKDSSVQKERIYQQYLKAYKKGVFNYIKEDVDTISQQIIPRKYFSGGVVGFKESNLAMVSQFTAAGKWMWGKLLKSSSTRVAVVRVLLLSVASKSIVQKFAPNAAMLSDLQSGQLMAAAEYERQIGHKTISWSSVVYQVDQITRNGWWQGFDEDLKGSLVQATAILMEQDQSIDRAAYKAREIAKDFSIENADVNIRGNLIVSAAELMRQGYSSNEAIHTVVEINKNFIDNHFDNVYVRGSLIIATVKLMGKIKDIWWPNLRLSELAYNASFKIREIAKQYYMEYCLYKYYDIPNQDQTDENLGAWGRTILAAVELMEKNDYNNPGPVFSQLERVAGYLPYGLRDLNDKANALVMGSIMAKSRDAFHNGFGQINPDITEAHQRFVSAAMTVEVVKAEIDQLGNFNLERTREIIKELTPNELSMLEQLYPNRGKRTSDQEQIIGTIFHRLMDIHSLAAHELKLAIEEEMVERLVAQLIDPENNAEAMKQQLEKMDLADLNHLRVVYRDKRLSTTREAYILLDSVVEAKWRQWMQDNAHLLHDQAMSSPVLAHVQMQRISSDYTSQATKGGIDFNSANLNLIIKRDGHGVPLPMAQQDLAQLSRIPGFEPEILSIQPAINLPVLKELQHQLQPSVN